MIRVLEVNNIDLPGRRFNGYDFISEKDLADYDIKQFVLIKQSKNLNVIQKPEIENIFYRLQEYEKINSIHNLFSITSDTLLNLSEYCNADIIHFHMFHNTKLSIPSLLKFASQKKIILSLHDPWFITGRCVHFYNCPKWQSGCKDCHYLNTLFPFENDNCDVMWKIKKETFSNIDIDIVVSSRWMYDLVKKSPILNKQTNIHYVPFGIDIEKFKPMEKKSMREKLNIPQDDVVLFFRAQNEFKGTEYIVKALKKLNKKKNVTLLTCDNVGLLKEIEKDFNIIELGLADDDVLLEAYNACDIFLMPSKGESFGMMAIEAMACEKPVIIFDNTALPSVTHAPECGYLVKNNDVEDLLKAIETLINNPSERVKRGKLGRKICQKEYSYKNYINNISQLYEKVYAKENLNQMKNRQFNNDLTNKIVENLTNFLECNQSNPLNKRELEMLTLNDINHINSELYNKYILNKESKIKTSFKQKLKNILKKSRVVRKVYNFFKKEVNR